MSIFNRLDSWFNAISGLGTARDKRTYSAVAQPVLLTPQQCEALFSTDLGFKMANTLPETALREGFTLTGGDGREREEVREVLESLEARKKVLEAALWGRVYGGSLLIPGYVDGQEDLSLPLISKAVKEIRFLSVLDKQEVNPGPVDMNPRSPTFGLPSYYDLTSGFSGGTRIHASRVIPFYGPATPKIIKRQLQGWNYSVYQKIYAVLADFESAFGSVGSMLQDASQAVFKLQGLIKMIGQNGQQHIRDRMEIVDMSRSIARAIILDADKEEFSYNSRVFTGLDSILELYMLRLASAADMPVTVLFGRSPAGMNATGESDLEGWYGCVESYRTHEVGRPLALLANMVRTSLGIKNKLGVDFPSLWLEGPAAIAEREKKIAEKDAIYIDKGVYKAEDVAKARAISPDSPVEGS